MSDRGLTAAAADDGIEAWATKLPFGDGPVLALAKPPLVCAAGDDGTLYAVDAATGKEAWSADLLADAPADPPGFSGGSGPTGRDQGPADRPGHLRRGRVRQRVRPVPRGRLRRRHRQAALVVPDRRVGLRQRRGDGQVRLRRQPGRPLLLPRPADRQEGLELQDEQPGRVGRGGGRASTSTSARATGTCTAWLRPTGRSGGSSLPTAARGAGGVPSTRSRSCAGTAVYFAAGEGQVYALDRNTGRLKGKVRPSERSDMYCSLAADDEIRLFGVTRCRDRSKNRASRRWWPSG